MTTTWFCNSVQFYWKHPRNQHNVSIPHWLVSLGWRYMYLRSPWLAFTVCFVRGAGGDARFGIELFLRPNRDRKDGELMFQREVFAGFTYRDVFRFGDR